MVWSQSKQYYTLPKSLHTDIFIKIKYAHKGALRRAMSSAYTKWQNSTSTTRTSLIHSRKKKKKNQSSAFARVNRKYLKQQDFYTPSIFKLLFSMRQLLRNAGKAFPQKLQSQLRNICPSFTLRQDRKREAHQLAIEAALRSCQKSKEKVAQ